MRMRAGWPGRRRGKGGDSCLVRRILPAGEFSNRYGVSTAGEHQPAGVNVSRCPDAGRTGRGCRASGRPRCYSPPPFPAGPRPPNGQLASVPRFTRGHSGNTRARTTEYRIAPNARSRQVRMRKSPPVPAVPARRLPLSVRIVPTPRAPPSLAAPTPARTAARRNLRPQTSPPKTAVLWVNFRGARGPAGAAHLSAPSKITPK